MIYIKHDTALKTNKVKPLKETRTTRYTASKRVQEKKEITRKRERLEKTL